MEEDNKVKNNNIPKFIGIAVLIILIIAVCMAGYYYFKTNNAKTVFTSTINSYLDNYEKNASKEIKTQNSTIKLSGNINTEDEVGKQVAEYINKTSLELNTQFDYETKNALVKLNVDYDNDKMIDGKIYYDLNEKTVYAYVQDLFDKYFKVDLNDSEYDELNDALKEVFEAQSKVKIGEKVSLSKANKILKEKISDKLNDEYFSKEKAEVTVNGKQVKTTKFKMSLTQTQFVDLMKSLFKELSEDEEFLNCWEDKDDLKELLSDFAEQLESAKKNDKIKVEFNIYKTGLLNKFVKFETLIYEDGIPENEVKFEIVKNNDKVYEYKVSVKGQEYDTFELSGNVNIEKIDKNTNKYVLTMNIPDFGEITINFEVSDILNEKIEDIDKSNSISIEDLTEEDVNTLSTNLQKMKLYEFIQSFSSNTSKITDIVEDNKLTSSITNNNNNNTTTNDNSVKSYSGDFVVSYSVPSSFESGSYNNDNYKTYSKSEDDVDVAITVSTDTLEEFSSSIDSTKEYFEKSEDYTDIEASDIETREVNGKEFKIRTLSYTYKSSVSSEYDVKYKTMYIYHYIDDNNSLSIKIENADNITDDEINQFLNINITK